MNINKIKNNKNEKVLIIGGTGFIGQHLVKRLANLNFELTVISLRRQHIIEGQSNVTTLNIDINNTNQISQIIQNNDFAYIINLSGYINHSTFWEGGYEVINDHFVSQLNLIHSLKNSQIKRYIHIGTSNEYGNSELGQLESNLCFPISSYAYAKLSVTNLIKMLHTSVDFPGVVIRLFLVYGPHQKTDRLIPYLINNCLLNKKYDVSHGTQYRDFCYIDDVIDGIIACMLEDKAIGEIFNIASGQAIQVKKIISKIQMKIGQGRANFGCYKKEYEESMILYADINKAKNLLRWEPKISISDGLDKTINYYKEW